MLSFADANQLESLEDKAVNRFRPWWEVFTFYSLNGLLMVVTFALAGVTISGTYAIWCFPVGNDTALDTSIVAYANARCSRIFEGRYLIYFPYGMFLEWTVFLAVQLLWFRLPGTFFLFQQLSEVFSEFSTLKPVQYNTQKRMRRGIAGLSSKLTGLQLNENKDTKEKIRHLVNRLMEILQKNNSLLLMYAVKAIFLSLCSAIVVIVSTQWLSTRGWHASFYCDMTLYIPVVYKDMTCSLPAAPFLYGLMTCNIIFAFSICLCNLRAIIWILRFKTIYSHYREAFGKWQFLVEKIGFRDFCFCLNLTSSTSKNGKILGDIIYSSMKLYQRSDQLAHAEPIQEFIQKPKFSSKFYQGEIIACNLGLRLLESKIYDDSIFHGLAILVGMEKSEVSQRIAEELISNISIYKDLVDSDINCPVFEDCVELIQVEKKSPKEFQHYVLMAACNAFHLNIVVFRAGSKCWYYKAQNEDEMILTKYMLFIQPSYYAAAEDDATLQDKQENQHLFISDPLYHSELQRKALLSWEKDGIEKYKETVKALKPKVISYGTMANPEVNQPTNVLSDLFSEMGHKISKQILNKIYIPGLQTQNQNPDINI